MNKMIPKHLQSPVEFLPMGNDDTEVFDKLMRYYQKEIARLFMIPIELLPLSSELSGGRKSEDRIRRAHHFTR